MRLDECVSSVVISLDYFSIKLLPVTHMASITSGLILSPSNCFCVLLNPSHSETLATLGKLAISNEELQSCVKKIFHQWVRAVTSMSDRQRMQHTGKKLHDARVWDDVRKTVRVSVCKDETISHRTTQRLKYSMAINIYYWVVHTCVCTSCFSSR